jgi:hypothetical protein
LGDKTIARNYPTGALAVHDFFAVVDDAEINGADLIRGDAAAEIDRFKAMAKPHASANHCIVHSLPITPLSIKVASGFAALFL